MPADRGDCPPAVAGACRSGVDSARQPAYTPRSNFGRPRSRPDDYCLNKDEAMSRVCELTGKGTQVGNNVSHANNKTKRRWLPNLQNVTFMSEALGSSHTFRVSTNGARSVEHVGGLDKWLLKTSDVKLSTKAQRLKRQVAKKVAEPTAA